MAALDFAKAKADIAEIVEIVNTVPEALQQRCFELLFEKAFAGPKAGSKHEGNQSEAEEGTASADQAMAKGAKKLPTNVLAFVKQHNISDENIGKLFMLEHDPLLQIYKIPTGNKANGQLVKVMMVLLENGLLNNNLSAPYSELRESVQEADLYDTNFNRNLRRNAALFRGAIAADEIDETGVVSLSGTGMERLAEIIKELGQ